MKRNEKKKERKRGKSNIKRLYLFFNLQSCVALSIPIPLSLSLSLSIIFRCENQTCVSSSAMCAVGLADCPNANHFQCNNGSCVSSSLSCASSSCMDSHPYFFLFFSFLPNPIIWYLHYSYNYKKENWASVTYICLKWCNHALFFFFFPSVSFSMFFFLFCFAFFFCNNLLQ